jgi:uncharacterized protein YndB with AHSA1/START domain
MSAKTYTVERSTIIDAPAGSIYAQLADFHHWAQWSPWEDVDPGMQRTYSGPRSGAGARYAWSGNSKAGRGQMEITDATEPTRVVVDLVFEKPFKARNDTTFVIQPEGDQSRVTWSMTGQKTLVIKLMSLATSMDRFLGRDFEKGLARLKSVSEGSGSAAP